MDIAEVAKSSGLPASTLRYYEDKGLIQSIGRKGIRRMFASEVLQQLALISLARNAGFSLDEIQQMFQTDAKKIDRQLLLDKADQLDKQIKQLSNMAKGLRHAAACPAEHHFACDKFLRLLKISNNKRFKPTSKL